MIDKSLFIKPHELTLKVNEVRDNISMGLFDEKNQSLLGLTSYLKGQLRILARLKNKKVLDESALVKDFITLHQKTLFVVNSKILEKYNIKVPIDKIKVKDLAKIPRFELDNFEGIRAKDIYTFNLLLNHLGLKFER